MSLNTAHANGGVLIFNGEMILLYCNGVELGIEGSDAKSFGGTKKGRIYLTTHRMIFMNKTEKDPLQSFSFPFFSMSAVELEQPVFGVNYIKGKVVAQPQGNWTGQAVFKLKFFSGGAIEFGQAMVKTAQMARQYMPPAPPPYTPQQGPYYPAPPPAYMPPGGGVAGFMPPTHAFPDAPPANSVYTSDMPPPYPGIYPPSYYPPAGNQYPPAGNQNPPTGNEYPQPGNQYPPTGYPPAGNQYPPPGNQYPPPGNQFYPQGPAPGQGGPAPPGFSGATGGSAPPPYYNGPTAPPPGPYAQHNGMAQQAPPHEDSKSGYPPMNTAYRTGPYTYSVAPAQNMNGSIYYPPEPPPPYAPGADKKEQ